MLPSIGAGARDSRVDGEQRGARHGVLQPGPRGATERRRACWEALVERAYASTERDDLRLREFKPRDAARHSLLGRLFRQFFAGCSRTMYSAYQSGQLASACPIRASCWPCAAAARRSACDRSLATCTWCRRRHAQAIAS